MTGKLIRLAVAYDEEGQPVGIDVAHGRIGMVTFEGGEPEETVRQENVSLEPDDLSAGTRKLMQSLGESLTADVTARLKKDVAVRRQAAADELAEAKRQVAEAQAAEKRAATNALEAAEQAREAERRATGG